MSSRTATVVAKKEEEGAEEDKPNIVDDGSNPVSSAVLQLLPEDALISIFHFADGFTLSSCLVAFTSHQTFQRLTVSTIGTVLRRRVESLKERGGFPLGDKLWEEILSTKTEIQLADENEEEEVDERSSFDSDDWKEKGEEGDYTSPFLRLSTKERSRHAALLRSTVGHISDQLAILSFFEDCRYQIRTKDGTELPLWCGRISMNQPPSDEETSSSRWTRFGGHRSQTCRVMATSPIDTWSHRLLRDWERFGGGRSSTSSSLPPPLLKPTIRRALPLPPVVRLTGMTEEDDTVLSSMSNTLNRRDEVARLDCQPKTLVSEIMSTGVIFMSLEQVKQRWRDQAHFATQPKGMWPIRYTCQPFSVVTTASQQDSFPVDDGITREEARPSSATSNKNTQRRISSGDNHSSCLFHVQERDGEERGEHQNVNEVRNNDDDQLFGFVQNAQFELECDNDVRREAVDTLIRLMGSYTRSPS